MAEPAIPAALRPFLVRIAAVALLALGLWAAWWWHAAHWRPAEARWPVQGVAVMRDNTPVDWRALTRAGASFAYIEATDGTRASAAYTAAVAEARAAGLRVGALHRYHLCELATDQAAAFVRMVAREDAALPAAVILQREDGCDQRPSRALLLSELTTFLNQIDTHSGKRSLIAPTGAFTRDYDLAGELRWPLWLVSNRAEPGPNAPRHSIWQANDRLRVEGASGTVLWLVLARADEKSEGGR